MDKFIFHDDLEYERVIKEALSNERREKPKMATLKDEAMAYEPPQTYNIADLEEVPVNLEIMDGEGTDRDGKPFVYKYAKLNNQEYRVPGVVLGEIKKILKLKPTVTKVKVIRKGSGLATKYEVNALD